MPFHGRRRGENALAPEAVSAAYFAQKPVKYRFS